MNSRTITAAGLCLLVFAMWSSGHLCASSEAHSGAAIQIEKSQSPNRSFGLFVLASPTNAERRLTLLSLESKAVLADVPLPKAAPAFGPSSTKASVLWKQDSAGVAVSFSDKTNSVIVA